MDVEARAHDRTHKSRKAEHLSISLSEPVESGDITTGLEKYRFIHQALPEMNLDDIDLSTTLLGKRLGAPLVISPMVGGIEPATEINRNLAGAAQAFHLGMGVGSQRSLIDNPELARTYQIRDIAPDILLFANLGAVQLNNGFGVAECLRLIEFIGADALVLHLNPLQEALQPEGNTNFAGLIDTIGLVCRKLPVPVVVKEVGYGISESVASRLVEAGVAGIDVAGAGGTCWSQIEGLRATGTLSADVAREFSSWGIPTADSIVAARKAAPLLPIIASGGIRTGLDIAKAIALGADCAGIAGPLLKAANESQGEVEQFINRIIQTLKTAMFCISAGTVDELKNSPHLRKEL